MCVGVCVWAHSGLSVCENKQANKYFLAIDLVCLICIYKNVRGVFF